jgi:hypothetical protein
VCIDEKVFKQELKRLNVRDSFLSHPSAHATAHFYENKAQEKKCCIICMHPSAVEREKTNPEGVVALLVHEAVHLWQYIKEDIGEHNPSKEFEAYAIQNLTQELLQSYNIARDRYIKRKNKKK